MLYAPRGARLVAGELGFEPRLTESEVHCVTLFCLGFFTKWRLTQPLQIKSLRAIYKIRAPTARPILPSALWFAWSRRAVSHCPVAAVGHDDGAGDIGRQIRGEEDRRTDHVLRLAGAAERRALYRKPRNVGIVGASSVR